MTFPIILNRKQIYILPTHYGMLFILILTGMLLGSMNYNNNLGFLLTFLLGGMAFVSILHTFRNIAGIRIISARSSKPVFAGDTAIFTLCVHADSISRQSIRFAFNKQEHIQKDLPALSDSIDIDLRMQSKMRGILKAEILTISTTYPLGLFRAWSKAYLDIECVVYPRPIPGSFRTTDIGSEIGNGETQDSKQGVDDFRGLRAYQPGDSLRHISWKSFSRGRGLLIKEFGGKTGTSVLLDWHALTERDTEQKLSRLCDMVLKAGRLNLEYGLKLPGNLIEPGKGETHRHKCLKALAVF